MDSDGLLSSSEDDEVLERLLKTYRPRVNFEIPSDFLIKEKFRLRKPEFEFVLTSIGPYLQNSDRNRAFSLSPHQQLLVALHWMGNGGAYHGIGDMHGISKSTVCKILKMVVVALVDHFFQTVVRFPPNMANVASEFLRIGGFPSVAACVDGTLINLDAPPEDEQQFVDRYGNHSLNVMMACSPDYLFYHVNARWPVSVHDARVLRTSNLSTRFENGWRPFPGALMLGDSGYPLKDWLITPYHHNPNDEAENTFNARHKC